MAVLAFELDILKFCPPMCAKKNLVRLRIDKNKMGLTPQSKHLSSKQSYYYGNKSHDPWDFAFQSSEVALTFQ